MAEVKGTKVIEKPVVDPWQGSKENWEYISIPAENALGFVHDEISNNKHVFKPGQTYLVPPEVAADVRDRLQVYLRATVRTLQPGRDMKAVNAVPVGGARATDSEIQNMQ